MESFSDNLAGVGNQNKGRRILFLDKVTDVYKRQVKKLSKNNGVSSVGLIVAGLSGALTNTLLVMNLIFVFFRNDYAAANGITVKAVYGFILSIIGINGIPEAIVAAVITLVLGKTLMKKGVQERLGV